MEADEADRLRLGARTVETETDQGLPIRRFGSRPSTWSRTVNPRCWGKYRHTMAVVRGGTGTRSASFAATIPRAGQWDLELHLPNRRGFSAARKWGTWHMTVLDGTRRREVTFDSSAGSEGWNLVGAFDVAGGEVTVELSDRTDGQVVIADAVRWSRSAVDTGEAKR